MSQMQALPCRDVRPGAKTRMADVIVDPKQHPEAIIPDFSKADPLLTFKLEDLAFSYGSKWKQRCLKDRL